MSNSIPDDPDERLNWYTKKMQEFYETFLEENPNLGNRFCNGICPPSNPAFTLPPDLDFKPLCPLPAVFPKPLPIPLPTLLEFLREPGEGLIVFSLMFDTI